ncbi:hypothetical protein QQS21_007448 [Conoideocrella luteorostrata]|uniref:Cytochrome P450 n=1 Tax=Conoideocrella luteorostrata TaxID=1105319 RepID=A0AAJ0CL16_9HYPO|nr:hypothetical protein QQS21_007448 [Conoideocrella luteorostrata]
MRGRLIDFNRRSKELFLQGRRMFQKNPYRVNCEWGDVVVLHPDFIDEIRNDPRMNFAIPTSDDLHSYIPGFDPFVASDPFARVVRIHLTKKLTKVTGPLSIEAGRALRDIFTDSRDWHEISPKNDIHTFVARMSSLVFMGEELCRDQEWIEASSDWIKQGFILRDVMGQYPRFIRPYIHWFMPSCWELRRMLKRVRAALAPHLQRREEIKAECAKDGRVIKYNDCIEWFSQEYKAGYDPAIEQMTLSLVANHTTSDLTVQAMLDIVVRPHLFKPLREEIVRVLGANGLKKTSLYKLKLMDSVLKETQRMKPVMIATFRRLATEDVRLSDGFLIKKGTRVVFENTHMWDEKYYENPLEYDAYRWVKVREDPAREHLGHLVSTSAQHMGFSHGMHSCPGRFFAANEIKIALCHILLKYDWKLPDDAPEPKPLIVGMGILPDPNARLLVRRRTPELNLELLEAEGFNT